MKPPVVSLTWRRDGAVVLTLRPSTEASVKITSRLARVDPLLRKPVCPVSRLPEVVLALRAEGYQVQWDGDGILEACARCEAKYGESRTAAKLRAWDRRLFPYQQDGVRWLASRWSGMLADEMGLGKTAQALLAADDRVIVVCPGVAKGVWEREAQRWRPDLSPVVLQGRGSFRWPKHGEIVILNYDILEPDPGGYAYYVTLIFDEAHALKNAKARRSIAARALADSVRYTHGRVWLLTATPMLNHGGELWEVLRTASLEKEAFGSWETYCTVMGGYRDTVGKKTVQGWGKPIPLARTMLDRVMFRRLRKDVLPELPGKVHQDIPVVLDRKHMTRVEETMASLRAVGWDVDRIVRLIEYGQRKGDAIPFSLLTQLRSALAQGKALAMLDLVCEYEAAGEPLIVFSAHRLPIDVLANRHGWATITGDVPNHERAKIESDFQAGKYRGIGGTIAAMGVAVTLTRAAHTLFVDHAWTPALNEQAEDRSARIGQTRGCIVRHLVANHPVDERVARVLRRKTEAIEGIL